MKKILLVTLLVLAVSPNVFALEDTDADDRELGVMYEALEDENFYRSPINNRMPVGAEDKPFSSLQNYSFDYGKEFSEINSKSMPLFKQLRLRTTNKLIELDDKFSNQELSPGERFVMKIRSLKDKRKAKKLQNIEESNESGAVSEIIQSEIQEELSEGALSFETGINKQITEKQLMLDCENVNFDEETGDMVAIGRPLLFLPPQNTKIVADKMVYNEASNILKGIGNVVVTKDGIATETDYVEVDMNEETVFMDKVFSQNNNMIMEAEKGIQKDAVLTLTNGKFHSEVSEIHRLASRMIGPAFQSMIVDSDDKSLFFGDPTGNKLRFDIDTLDVDAREHHNIINAKHIEISRNGRHWLTWPSLKIYTNKERKYFEANYPEFGSRRKVGMFLGPGFVFGGPGDSVIKAIPFVNYQRGKIGIGGALKYRNTFNTTELGYGSSANVFFLRGMQRLDDNLFLQYSYNSFMDEWFLGSRMPKYMAELFYDKQYEKRNFLAEGKNLTFRHRLGFGLMEDNDRNYYGEKLRATGTTTTKLRYMAEVRQSIYSYSRPEDRFFFDLSIALQGSASVYGTGDTQFIGRIGPRAHIQYKNWMQDLGYYQSGYDDQTPMPRYDAYRYGHSSIYISEIFRLNKYISVGWSGNINLSDDAPNGKMFQENRFVVALGPDDLKIRLGYDFVRQMTYFGFDVAFDTKGTNVNYKKMTIKNPEKLGKNDKQEERKIAYTPTAKKTLADDNEVKIFSRKQKASKKPVLEYAQVIEIEDPDKELVE